MRKWYVEQDACKVAVGIWAQVLQQGPPLSRICVAAVCQGRLGEQPYLLSQWPEISSLRQHFCCIHYNCSRPAPSARQIQQFFQFMILDNPPSLPLHWRISCFGWFTLIYVVRDGFLTVAPVMPRMASVHLCVESCKVSFHALICVVIIVIHDSPGNTGWVRSPCEKFC